MAQHSPVGGRSRANWLVGSSLVALVIILALWRVQAHSANIAPGVPRLAGRHGPYSTNFSRSEDPISEGGKWKNGGKDGLDWTDVRTSGGLAFGTEIGGDRPDPQKYDDSTALLKGTWGPNQTLQATVHSVNPNQSGKVWEEVELRLRSAMSLHNCTGYEVMFRCSKIPQAYCNIARWEGPLGKFTYIAKTKGSKYGVKTGDVVKATIIGDVLRVYINGVQIIRVTDGKFATGNPGMGFYLEGATGVMHDYGFTSFMATDR